MDYVALGDRVRTKRRMVGMTQEELAGKAGISCSFMGHIERGTRKLSLETLVALADALNVTTDFLLQDSMPIRNGSSTAGLSERKENLLREISILIRETDFD